MLISAIMRYFLSDSLGLFHNTDPPQWAIICSKLLMETLEQGVKYVQS